MKALTLVLTFALIMLAVIAMAFEPHALLPYLTAGLVAVWILQVISFLQERKSVGQRPDNKEIVQLLVSEMRINREFFNKMRREIAVSTYDEACWFRKKHHKRTLSKDDIQTIATQAADKFLRKFSQL